MNIRCAPNVRIDGLLPLKQMPAPSFVCPLGWDLLLSDAGDTRALCFVFRYSVEKASSFKQVHGQAIGRTARVVCAVPESVNIEQQLKADAAGIELWFVDPPNLGRSLNEHLEFAANYPQPQRVRPDESVNFDLETLDMLRQACPHSNNARLLREAKTLHGIVTSMDQRTVAELGGNDEVTRFFSQIL